MRLRHTSLALLCVVAETFVTLSLAEHVVHERAVSTNGWVKLGNINADGLLPVRIALTQQNLDQGHELLMERYRDSTLIALHVTDPIQDLPLGRPSMANI
jgi:tripeptidyl-peptidase-1